jgi:hypothetical protein
MIIVITLSIWHACHAVMAITAFVVTFGPIIIIVIVGILILRRIIVIPSIPKRCSWTHGENHILHARSVPASFQSGKVQNRNNGDKTR